MPKLFDLDVLQAKYSSEAEMVNVADNPEATTAVTQPQQVSAENKDKCNREVLSKIICSLLSDYSADPEFITEWYCLSSLKGFTKACWDLVKSQITSRIDTDMGISGVNLDFIEYDWLKTDARTIHDLVNQIWKRLETQINKAAEENYNNLYWDSEAIYAQLKSLKLAEVYLNSIGSQVSDEGLVSIFINVTDSFLKVGNAIKTNLFKFYKSLKRSELRTFYESNMIRCHKVENVDILTATKLKVVAPSGMKGTYIDAIQLLKQSYEIIDMVNLTKSTTQMLATLRQELMRDQNYKSTIQTMHQMLQRQGQSLDKLSMTLNRVFTDKHTPSEVPFIERYKTMQDFKNVRLELLDMEHYLSEVNQLVKAIDATDVILADITAYIDVPKAEETSNIKVDKQTIQTLSDTIKYLAVAYDNYGVTVMRQMALEHNHINSINRLWAVIE